MYPRYALVQNDSFLSHWQRDFLSDQQPSALIQIVNQFCHIFGLLLFQAYAWLHHFCPFVADLQRCMRHEEAQLSFEYEEDWGSLVHVSISFAALSLHSRIHSPKQQHTHFLCSTLPVEMMTAKSVVRSACK